MTSSAERPDIVSDLLTIGVHLLEYVNRGTWFRCPVLHSLTLFNSSERSKDHLLVNQCVCVVVLGLKEKIALAFVASADALHFNGTCV